MQKGRKNRFFRENDRLVTCPRECLKTALVAKAFVSASSKTAAWRVFFESGFLECFKWQELCV